MTSLPDVYEHRLIIESGVTLTGIAAGGVVVKPGGVLRASGIISGPLVVESGARVMLSGVLSGSLQVDVQGSVDITGVLNGPVLANDGDVVVAVGAVIHGGRLMSDGSFARADTAEAVTITNSTPRYHMRGFSPRLEIDQI